MENCIVVALAVVILYGLIEIIESHNASKKRQSAEHLKQQQHMLKHNRIQNKLALAQQTFQSFISTQHSQNRVVMLASARIPANGLPTIEEEGVPIFGHYPQQLLLDSWYHGIIGEIYLPANELLESISLPFRIVDRHSNKITLQAEPCRYETSFQHRLFELHVVSVTPVVGAIYYISFLISTSEHQIYKNNYIYSVCQLKSYYTFYLSGRGQRTEYIEGTSYDVSSDYPAYSTLIVLYPPKS